MDQAIYRQCPRETSRPEEMSRISAASGALRIPNSYAFTGPLDTIIAFDASRAARSSLDCWQHGTLATSLVQEGFLVSEIAVLPVIRPTRRLFTGTRDFSLTWEFSREEQRDSLESSRHLCGWGLPFFLKQRRHIEPKFCLASRSTPAQGGCKSQDIVSWPTSRYRL